jgi:hypothetical protein
MSDRTITTAAWTTGNLAVNAGGLIVAVAAQNANPSSNIPTAPSVEDQDYVTPDGFANAVLEHRIEATSGNVPVAGAFNAAPSVRLSVVGASYDAISDVRTSPIGSISSVGY